MSAAAIAEFFGTFFFITCILASGAAGIGAPLAIAVGLLAAIIAFGQVSGGHFNPAVSFCMLAKGSIDTQQFLTYTFAQMLGGICALVAFKALKQGDGF